jgi:hypothetical protein
MMARADAVALGVAIGRARRWPTSEEVAAHRSLGLEECLRRGIHRGRRLAALLEQTELAI